MNCRRFLERLEKLDGSPFDRMSDEMRAHADGCLSCAAAEASMKAALACYRLPEALASLDLVPRISALLPFLPAPRRLVSMRDWVMVGLFLLGGMVLLPLLAAFGTLKNAYGTGFTLPMALVLGVLITSYAVMFIFSHIDELARRLNVRTAGHA